MLIDDAAAPRDALRTSVGSTKTVIVLLTVVALDLVEHRSCGESIFIFVRWDLFDSLGIPTDVIGIDGLDCPCRRTIFDHADFFK